MSSKTRIELGRRADLGADCANCFGLCCVALAFARSADFPFDKPAGDPCVNLDDSDGCRIHGELRQQGFKGCTVFDCFGAGQKVSQVTFAGRSWRDDGETRTEMFTVFPIVRRLHELLWYLDRALQLIGTGRGSAALTVHFTRVQKLSGEQPARLLAADVDHEYDIARPLLLDASAAVRRDKTDRVVSGRGEARLRPGADLVGADLADTRLRGADLRGALLIGADLTGADLSWCDVLGVDLRDADVSGALLKEAIYLTQMQVNSARGNAGTTLPDGFERPSHWE
jgi:hypothetical protein